MQAYILTASSEDHNSKHYLRYFGRCELGPFEFIVTDFKPYMYIEKGIDLRACNIRHSIKSSDKKNIYNEALDKVEFYTQKEHSFFRKYSRKQFISKLRV